MGWLNESGFWLGKHPSLGLVLIDSGEDHGGPHLSVFIIDQKRLAEFVRSSVDLRDVNVSEDVAKNAVEAFFAERLDRRHTEFLIKHHLKPADIRRRSRLIDPRKTRCFHCHVPLDSTISFECVGCGWILCECGACGCTWGVK